MVLKNSLNFINEFLFYLINQTRKIYLNSSFYNNKISKIDDKSLGYKPSPSLLGCLVDYDKKKEKIEDFYLNSIWKNKNIKEKDFKKLHNYFWLFTLDLKSSKKITQSIILMPIIAKTKKDNDGNIVGLNGFMIFPTGYYSKTYFKPLKVNTWNTYWQWGTVLVAPYYGLGTEYIGGNGFFFGLGTVYFFPLISFGKYF